MGLPDPPTADFRVLCAGAVRVGVEACLAEYARRTGARGAATFVNGPTLEALVAEGRAGAEVVVAPDRDLERLYRAGRINRAPQHALGRVSAGAVVRNDAAPRPGIGTLAALSETLRAADAVVFARGTLSAGIERLIARLGLADALRDRTVRVAHGADVVTEIAAGRRGHAIGLAQSTEILRVIAGGVAAAYLGALPPDAAIHNRYMAGLAAGPQPRSARRFVRFLGNVAARPILRASGIEPDG